MQSSQSAARVFEKKNRSVHHRECSTVSATGDAPELRYDSCSVFARRNGLSDRRGARDKTESYRSDGGRMERFHGNIVTRGVVEKSRAILRYALGVSCATELTCNRCTDNRCREG